MKKLLKTFVILMIFVVGLTAFSGCNLVKKLMGDDEAETEFALTVNSIEIKIGSAYEVKTADGVSEDFTLSSDDVNEEYISITGHKITGKKITSNAIVVTATSESGESVTINVTVIPASVSFVEIEILNDVDAYQLLSNGESPKEIEFGIKYNEGASVTASQVTWTLHVGSLTYNKKGLTYTYTPTKDIDYTLDVSVGSQTASIDFGAHGAIYISSEESFEVGEDINVGIVFIATDYNNNDYVNFAVTIDGVTTNKNLKIIKRDDDRGYANFPIPSYSAIGTHTVSVTVDGNKSNDLTINVEKYVTAERVKISFVGSHSEDETITQYGTKENVTFVATVTPTNTDKDNVKWYVNGVAQSATGTTFNFTPNKEGNTEYHIQAKIDNLKSNINTIIYLSSNTDTENNYISNIHNYGGYAQNTYITSAEELKNIVLYAIENQYYGSSSDKLSLYMGYNYQASVTLDVGEENTDVNRFKQAISDARNMAEESGILPGFNLSYSNNTQYDIYFIYELTDSTPTVNAPTKDAPDTVENTTQSTLSKPHYTSGTTHAFYIDSATKTMEVTTSNMLYKAVQWGYKPTFESNANGVLLKQIYDNARDALSKIITADMTDLQKVHAIYDWIIYNVRYDYDCSNAKVVYEDSATKDLNEKMNYYAYYLEGIFLDKFYNYNDMHAVCDGRSKAFVLMCAIEGIEAVRIAGVADTTGQGWTTVSNPDYYYEMGYNIFIKVNNSYVVYKGDTFGSDTTYYINISAGGHAWNKVLLDVGGEDNKKEWFFVDTTWGDNKLAGNCEYLNHAYFLLNDNDIADTHAEYSGHNYPSADGDYDYYEAKTVEVDGVTQSYKVTNLALNTASQQLTRILKYEKSIGSTYIEFESPYAYGTMSCSNMINDAIQSTYRTGYGISNPTGNVIILTIN